MKPIVRTRARRAYDREYHGRPRKTKDNQGKECPKKPCQSMVFHRFPWSSLVFPVAAHHCSSPGSVLARGSGAGGCPKQPPLPDVGEGEHSSGEGGHRLVAFRPRSLCQPRCTSKSLNRRSRPWYFEYSDRSASNRDSCPTQILRMDG